MDSGSAGGAGTGKREESGAAAVGGGAPDAVGGGGGACPLDGKWVAPGDRLGHASDFAGVGPGCYTRGVHVHASVVGICTVDTVTGDQDSAGGAVKPQNGAPSGAQGAVGSGGGGGATEARARTVIRVAAPHATPPVVPVVGNVVTAKVVSISRQVARVSIMCVGEVALKERFSGIVRRENIRGDEIDRVEVQKSMRPGDIIKAEVVSLGDSRSYYLSTAKVELGVVFARSASSGTAMIPISWQEMQCPITKTKEFRKVAKGRSVAAVLANDT